MTAIEDHARSIFLAALDRAPDEWPAFLNEACGADTELRARVNHLLHAHQALGSIHVGGVHPPVVTLDALPVTERPGTVIGPYKLLQQIGEGGMGVVWMAEQTQPVQRKVALKVIKPGMDSRQVIVRFEAERQALAIMDHVNIARVFDAGATESGRPYFVMELIHGVPITKYCDDNHLTPRERLELFVPVCQAIQHAHQKGIIHRDIKPSNVMVTLYDGKPVPKVIDFGVAKATEQKLTERTLFTQYGTMVGTLEYMSPEQAEMSALGVDTRSDIYSLGVLLYELLTGSTPLSHKRLKEAAYAEILRMIREEEPPKPSTRLSDSGEALAWISALRKTEPAKLSRLMRGELDWIVMKTLEKDRNRRYETANGFAADVQRYLNDEAVQACPPSATYQLRKFMRRNKGPVLAACLVLLALMGGMVGTTLGLIEARQQRDAAGTAAETEKKSKEIAEEREAETRAVLDFVENKIFAAARPENYEGGLGYEVTLRKAVEAALPFVQKSFTTRPLIEARLRMTLGLSFLYLGEAKIAAEQFQAARTQYAQRLGPYDHDTLSSMNNLAASYEALNRHADALKLNQETLALMKAWLGPDHPDTLSSMNNLANSFAALGRYPDALELHQETLALRKAKLGPDHPETVSSMGNLAACFASLGRHADALKVNQETLALMKAKLGPDHLDMLGSMHNLAGTYLALGLYTDALKLDEETLALKRAKLGPDHRKTLGSMTNLANDYAALSRHAEALELREKTLALLKGKLGPDDRDTLLGMNNLATSYFHLHRHADAVKLHEETLALRKTKLGPDDPDTLSSMDNLAESYGALGRNAEALELNQEALALMNAKLGPNHPHTLRSMNNLANTLAALGRHTDALKLREETLALRKAKLGGDHPETLGSMHSLAVSYDDLGRFTDALELHQETLALRKAKLGPDHRDTLQSMWGVVADLANLDRGVEAVPIIDECVKMAAGKVVEPRLIPAVVDIRLRVFEHAKDAEGCRATAEMWEKLSRTDADSLYDAACMRAVTAVVLRAGDKSEATAKNAAAEEERAMAWLEQSIAAGYEDAGHLAKDKDLDGLRDRKDFKKLVAALQAGNKKGKK